MDVVGETTENTVAARGAWPPDLQRSAWSRGTRDAAVLPARSPPAWTAHPTTCPRLRGVQVEAHAAAGVHGGVDRRRLDGSQLHGPFETARANRKVGRSLRMLRGHGVIKKVRLQRLVELDRRQVGNNLFPRRDLAVVLGGARSSRRRAGKYTTMRWFLPPFQTTFIPEV